MGLAFKAEDQYKRLIEELRATGDFSKLVNTLELIPKVVQSLLQDDMQRLEARIQELDAKIDAKIQELESLYRDMDKRLEELTDSYADLNVKYSEMNRRLSRLENHLGALSEAVLSRIVVEELVEEGFRIKEKTRNYRVNNEDIDLLIVAVSPQGEEHHIIVEVKLNPKHSDVGALIAKAELYEAKTGVKPQIVLAGAGIGSEVEAYAKSKGASVIRL